jgi:hypothetical protein
MFSVEVEALFFAYGLEEPSGRPWRPYRLLIHSSKIGFPIERRIIKPLMIVLIVFPVFKAEIWASKD